MVSLENSPFLVRFYEESLFYPYHLPIRLCLNTHDIEAVFTQGSDTMGKGGGGQGGRTSNDDRSDSMNPNNSAYQDSVDNRSDQLNLNNPEYKGDDEDEEE